jgi:hypothetical protein
MRVRSKGRADPSGVVSPGRLYTRDMTTIFTDARTFLLILIAIGFSIQQITVGHNLDLNTSLTLLVGAFGAGGVSVAHTAGVNAASAPVVAVPLPPPAA